MVQVDSLAAAIRAAEDRHVAALRAGDERAIRVAYIAALEAERALLLDCGGAADVASAVELGYVIDDERAALARMTV